MTEKRILIVGDSHCATLIQILAENSIPGYHIDIIAGIGAVAQQIAIEDGVIFFRGKPESWPVARDPAARHPTEWFDQWYDKAEERLKRISPDGKLQLASYDHLIFYGGRLNNTRWYNFPYQAGYSLELKYDAFCHVYQNSPIVSWVEALKHKTPPCRVHCMPDPLMNELGFDHEGDAASDLSILKLMPDGVSYEDMVPFFKDIFLKKYNVNYMPLPDTLLNPGKTATRCDFKVENPLDFGHVTKQGGQIILGKMLEEVDRA